MAVESSTLELLTVGVRFEKDHHGAFATLIKVFQRKDLVGLKAMGSCFGWSVARQRTLESSLVLREVKGGSRRATA